MSFNTFLSSLINEVLKADQISLPTEVLSSKSPNKSKVLNLPSLFSTKSENVVTSTPSLAWCGQLHECEHIAKRQTLIHHYLLHVIQDAWTNVEVCKIEYVTCLLVMKYCEGHYPRTPGTLEEECRLFKDILEGNLMRYTLAANYSL